MAVLILLWLFKSGSDCPPVAEKIPHELVSHGDTRSITYWMRLSG
ncbi:MAG: hypothetical protein R2727_05255 [Bacteroidales bacterium]